MTSESSGLQPTPGHSPIMEQEKTVISQRPAASPREFFEQMPLTELAATLEGKMLDHFSVVQLIGGGGMGAVFRGLDKRLERVVAIKVIPAARRDPAMLRRFRLEAQAAARLDHPNIARVYYVGEADQWDYIVFEFIDGINVRDLVEMEGPLSVDDAVFYTRQVAEALQHAHDRDVVHRDIKPSNILVTASGTAKLVDMGLARDTSLERSTQDRTASGVTLGTFDYISPEQAKNPRDADVRSDLYSLGCSLFFMLTGHPPFPDGTALQKLLNHGSLPPPDPRGWRDDLPDELCQILSKLMAKRPSDRYQKPIDLVNDLLLLAELDGLPRSQSPTTLMMIPTLAQPTLLETYLPWIVAFGVLLGSTLWLHSQMTTSGFALPAIQYPSLRDTPPLPKPSTANVLSRPTGTVSNLPSELLPDPVQETGDQSQALPLKTASVANMAPKTISPATSFSSDPREATLRGAPGSVEGSQALQSFPLPAFALPGTSGPSPSASSSGDTAKISSPLGNSGGANPGLFPTAVDPLMLLQQAVAANGVEPEGDSRSNEMSSRESGQPDGLDSRNTPIASPASSNLINPVNSSMQLPLIVVSKSPPVDVSAQYWESSLHRAVQRLAEQATSGIIEVRGSVWLDRPLYVGARSIPDSTAAKELIIRGSQDSDARIEVARGVWSNIAQGTGVVQIDGATLKLQNIQLQSVLNDTESIPRSLIQLKRNSALEAVGCTFTVQCERVSMAHLIAIGDDGPVGPAFSNSSSEIQTLQVLMKNCFVRGDASLVRIGQSNPATRQTVQISLIESLFALNGCAVDLMSPTGSAGIDRIARVYCQSATFACSEGFARMEYFGPDLPLVGLSRTAQACVFWSRPAVAHIAISGESIELKDNPDMLFLQGTNNAYGQQTQTLCQAWPRGQRSQDIGFRTGSQEGWFVERGNERAISWLKPMLTPRDFHKMTADDFALMPSQFVPGFHSSSDTPTRTSQ